MKKILLVGAFVLSAVTFANVHASHANHGTTTATAGMEAGKGMMGGMGSMMTPEMKAKMEAKGKMKDGKCSMMEMKGMMANLTPEQRIVMEKEMIDIDAKKLELRRLNNTAKPDAKRVETLTKEISTMEAKHMESMHKMMPTPAKTN